MPETVNSEFGFSYEYGLDIWDPAEQVWVPFRFPTGITFTVTPTTVDATTYDDLGSKNEVKISETWTGSFNVQQHRISPSGAYFPEIELLKSYTEPDATGAASRAKFRWYDKPQLGVGNPDDAYEGLATVEFNRGETGNEGGGSWAVSLTGVGRRKKIANPWKGWGVDPDPGNEG